MARIIIAENEESIRGVIGRALEREGHAIEAHPDGGEGLRAFQARGADLIITDILMPEVDGIELLLAVQRLAPGTPVIVISGGGYASAEHVLMDAGLLGAVHTLAKPFEMEELVAAVRAVLGAGRATDDGARSQDVRRSGPADHTHGLGSGALGGRPEGGS